MNKELLEALGSMKVRIMGILIMLAIFDFFSPDGTSKHPERTIGHEVSAAVGTISEAARFVKGGQGK